MVTAAALSPFLPLTASLLGQAAPRMDPWAFVWRVVPWALVLAGALVVLGLVYRWARRLMSDEGPTSNAFSLSELRRMRDQGVLSAEEFERAKKAVVTRELQALRSDEDE